MSNPVRDTIRSALHDEWWRAIREKIEDSPDGHVERLTDGIMRALEGVGIEMRGRIDAAVREAYGRGRDDEAAGMPIPDEYATAPDAAEMGA